MDDPVGLEWIFAARGTINRFDPGVWLPPRARSVAATAESEGRAVAGGETLNQSDSTESGLSSKRERAPQRRASTWDMFF